MYELINPLKKCIVLVGGMGCGKSTIGQHLHKDTGLPLIDIDHFIESRENCSIPEIFSRHGEEYFRDMETAVLKNLLAKGTPEIGIISTGGGIVKRKKNRKLLKKLGFVVWINLSPEVAFERIQHNKNRPLLQTEDPFGTLSRIMEERMPLYSEVADLIIDTAPLTPQEAAFGIIESARHHFSSLPDFEPKSSHPPRLLEAKKIKKNLLKRKSGKSR